MITYLDSAELRYPEYPPKPDILEYLRVHGAMLREKCTEAVSRGEEPTAIIRDIGQYAWVMEEAHREIVRLREGVNAKLGEAVSQTGKLAWPAGSRQEHGAGYLLMVDRFTEHRNRLDALLDRAGLSGWCERAEVVEAIEALIEAKLANLSRTEADVTASEDDGSRHADLTDTEIGR